jgi:hypothetical protein
MAEIAVSWTGDWVLVIIPRTRACKQGLVDPIYNSELQGPGEPLCDPVAVMKPAVIRSVDHSIERGSLDLVKGLHERKAAKDINPRIAGQVFDRYHHRDGLVLLGWR